VGIFNFLSRPRNFFSREENAVIVDAIREAERRTSGEVRVYVESKCRFVDPIDRAAEIFFGLQMEKTDHRNGVLVYVAIKDKQLAVFGDEGIHRKVGNEFWRAEVAKMLSHFSNSNHASGISQIVLDIGEALKSHFPFEREDKNELPDEIVFGR
jgi:uncharacterized membrane protein